MPAANLNTTGKRDVPGPDNAGPAAEAHGKAVGAVMAHRLPVSGGNLLMGGMFAAAVACVYLLSLRGGPAVASAQQQQAESRVDALVSRLSDLSISKADIPNDATAVVNSFYFDVKKRQVPLENLLGNPFVFQTFQSEFTPPQTPLAAAVASPGLSDRPGNGEASGEELEHMKQAAESLKLQSVLVGPRGAMAMISTNLLAKGQNIHGWTVSQIHPHAVVLTWADQEHTLRILE